MVGFATVATIIASQAIISGAYSLTQQAIQLGFLPRMRVLHTASHEKGQIYMPMVNWLLAAGTLGAVITFGSSDALGGAYGIAVSMLMAITTVLAALVALQWGYNPLAVAAVNGSLLVVEFIFVAANATKLLAGGWFPLLLACVVAFLMLTWRTGYQMLERQRTGMRQREDEFVDWVLENPPLRLPGAAAIFTAGSSGIPLALTHHLRHNRVLHECVLLVSTVSSDAPRVDPDQRVKLTPVGAGITRVTLHFGFMEHPNVMEGLKLACRDPDLRAIDPERITFYSRRVMVIPSGQGARDGGMEGAALCRDAPQCQSAGRLFRRPDRTGRRNGPRSRDLSDAVATLHAERLAKPARDVRRKPMAPGKQTGVRSGDAIRLGSPVQRWKPAIT